MTARGRTSQKKPSPEVRPDVSSALCAVRPSGSLSVSTTEDEPLAPTSPKSSTSAETSPSPPGNRFCGRSCVVTCRRGAQPVPHSPPAANVGVAAAMTATSSTAAVAMAAVKPLCLRLTLIISLPQRPVAVDKLRLIWDCFAPYLFLACRSHVARRRFGFFLHAFSACPSLRACVVDLGVAVPDSAAAGTTLPAPENVSLEGAPNSVGCGVGPGLHASPVVHGGGTSGGGGAHGADTVHSCASYRSTLVS